MLGRTLGGRYVIEQLVGKGGVGLVYQATSTALEQPGRVVVKVLAPNWEDDPEALARFRREAERLGGLTHPNIVKLIDFGEDRGRAFMVMEFLEGEQLSAHIEQRGRLSTEAFVPIASQILKGLGYAHSRGVIHRDLKPANVMLCEPDDSGNFVKLLDFGLARLVDQDEAITQQHVVGTTGFLAPEQIEGGAVDQRADVYALGVLFYTMLSGQRPFNADTKTAMFYKHLHEAPRSLDEVLPAGHNVPRGLMALIHKCLAKDPDERPHDAMELVEELIDCVDAKLLQLVPRGQARKASTSGTMVGLGFTPESSLRTPAQLESAASRLRSAAYETTTRGLDDNIPPAPLRGPAADSNAALPEPEELEVSESRTGLAAVRAATGSAPAVLTPQPDPGFSPLVIVGGIVAVLIAAFLTYSFINGGMGDGSAVVAQDQPDPDETLSAAEEMIAGGQFAGAGLLLDRYESSFKGSSTLERRAERLRGQIEVGKKFAAGEKFEADDNRQAALSTYREILEMDPSHAPSRARIAALTAPVPDEPVTVEVEVEATGTLMVVSKPPATLTVDGEEVGQTPFTGALEVGERELVLVAEGYRTLRKRVTVKEGEDNKPVKLRLRKGKSTAAPTKKSAASDGPPEETKEAPPEEPKKDNNLFLPTKKNKKKGVFLPVD